MRITSASYSYTGTGYRSRTLLDFPENPEGAGVKITDRSILNRPIPLELHLEASREGEGLHGNGVAYEVTLTRAEIDKLIAALIESAHTRELVETALATGRTPPPHQEEKQ